MSNATFFRGAKVRAQAPPSNALDQPGVLAVISYPKTIDCEGDSISLSEYLKVFALTVVHDFDFKDKAAFLAYCSRSFDVALSVEPPPSIQEVASDYSDVALRPIVTASGQVIRSARSVLSSPNRVAAAAGMKRLEASLKDRKTP